jgi:hypothetical protein
MAASLCKRYDTDPRGIYEEHLADLQKLMSRGVGKRPASDSAGPGPWRRMTLTAPSWLESAGENLARTADVGVPNAPNAGVRTCLLVNDGNGMVEDNGGRWICRGALPHIIEFSWEERVSIGAARIISGFTTGNSVVDPIEGFSLQWHDGSQWQDSLVSVDQNTSPVWAATFPPVRTQRARLIVHKTKDDISRIWEIEFYRPIRE